MKQERCHSITKNSEQCRKKAVPGSKYCLIHWPREVWLPLIVGAILGFILGGLASYLVGVHFHKKSLKENLLDRYISQQRYVPPAINGFPIIIADGTNCQIVRKPETFPIFGGRAFKFRVDEKGIIEIYGEIRYPDDTLVAMINKDLVNITPGTGIDINIDLKALEIVDGNENPIFQLSVIPYEQWEEQQNEKSQNSSNDINETLLPLGNLEPEVRNTLEQNQVEHKKLMQKIESNMFLGAKEVVIFYYVHHEENHWYCSTPSGSQKVDNLESMQKWQQKIPRLFKYPGHKYPGVRD